MIEQVQSDKFNQTSSIRQVQSDFVQHLTQFNIQNEIRSVPCNQNLLRPTNVSGITYSSVTTISNPWCGPGLGTAGEGADDGGPTPN